MDRRKFTQGVLAGAIGLPRFAEIIRSGASRVSDSWRGGMSRKQRIITPEMDGTLQAVTVIFGMQDHVPTRWDGSASISGGEILKIGGYHFGKHDQITGIQGWQASTKSWTSPAGFGDLNPNQIPRPRGTLVQVVGITLYVRAPDSAEIRLRLPGQAPVHRTPISEIHFRIGDLLDSSPLYMLDGRIQAMRVPFVEQITDNEYENDYPSATIDQSGNLWVGWVRHNSQNITDEVWIRAQNSGKWQEPIRVSPEAADIYSTAIAVDGRNRLWVVWSQRQGRDWHLMGRYHDRSVWSHVRPLTVGSGNNLFQALVADHRGNLHLVWQAFRGKASEIFLRTLRGDRWQPEMNLSDPEKGPRANDWAPAVVADRTGRVWVAWDSYAKGSYNVMLRSVEKGRKGNLLQVTDSPRFHAHASLAVDEQDRLWVAYDEAEENWGKDCGYQFNDGAGLYASRKTRIAIRAENQWLEPRSDLNEAVPVEARHFVQNPKLISDGQGRMWAIFRPRTWAAVTMTPFSIFGRWEVMASYYSGGRWSTPITVPESIGRNEGPFDVATDGKGHIWLAYNCDHHHLYGWGCCATHHVPEDPAAPPPGDQEFNNILVGCLSGHMKDEMLLGPRGTEPPSRPFTEPHEIMQVRAVRNYVINSGGKKYKIYRGDMHRHTEISGDGAGDGSLWDVHRYVLDAADLDYFAVTDHGAGGNQEYPWWRTQKSADMFHVPGFFIPMFGYERSINYPNGHRNIIFAHRGVRTLPNAKGESAQYTDDAAVAHTNTGSVLYPYLRKHHGISMPHSGPTVNMGTDWRDHDPHVEPLVEIFQGARTSAEHLNAPLAQWAGNPELEDVECGGVQELGWVWKAWAKGYKLGVQCSSDHTSTHCSYACILAESFTREGLLDAMRRRHSYGATTNIIMDYRARVHGAEYIMGDEFSSHEIPELYVKAVGTGKIKRTHIIRDNRYIHVVEGNGEEVEFTYRDPDNLEPGEHYYYVRMEQEDRHVAWSSPIWIKYRMG